jgi:hypothetical protein
MLYEEGSRDKRRIANVICGQPERFTFCTKRKDLSHTIMKNVPKTWKLSISTLIKAGEIGCAHQLSDINNRYWKDK